MGPRRPAAVPIRPPPRTVGPHRQPACPHGPGGPRLFRARGGGAASLPTWTRRACAARPPGPRPAHADQGAWGDAGGGAGSAAARRGTRQSAPSPRERYLLLARTVLIARENGTCSPRERYLFVVRADGASGCLWVRVARSTRQWVLGDPGTWAVGWGGRHDHRGTGRMSHSAPVDLPIPRSSWPYGENGESVAGWTAGWHAPTGLCGCALVPAVVWRPGCLVAVGQLRGARSVLRGGCVPRIWATRGRPGGLRAQFEVVHAEL